MASMLAPGLMEGQSNTRPPYFDGKDYNIWKNKMKAFLRSKDPLEWDVVEKGITPAAASNTERGKETVETSGMSQEEINKRQALDAKAIYSLYCALSPTEYNRISSCVTAKEVWDRLHITYEGTDRVKETRINILLGQYESFKMKPGESITDMFSRFTDIVNGLENQGQKISDPMKVNKLLRGLSKDWNHIKTSIRETQRIMPLSVDELIGTLQSYEVERINEDEDPRGKKSIALKSNDDSDDADSEDDMNDEELALMIRRFRKLNRKGRRFIPKKQSSQRQQTKSVDDEEPNKEVVCFECKKKGHIRPNCPLLKKKRGKAEKFRKALKAETWSDTECEESDEEYANLCLMAQSDSDSGSDSDSEFEVSDYKIPVKVSKYINELCFSLKTSLKRISELKKENSVLKQKENILEEKVKNLDLNVSTLKESEDNLSKENAFLKTDLSNISKKFSIGSEKLEKVLSIQRPYFNKSGLGMTEETIPLIDFPKVKERIKKRPSREAYKNHFKRVFVKPVGRNALRCSKCNSQDHFEKECPMVWKPVKRVWPNNAYPTNTKGPKKIWVPKKA
ncbi:uncharacterized protein [Rutidosis leptorrhynchoides]|uniref:uncharacterized protein n=1 Tax=Rutidosis leptorrhynchoides TaxID=125765 RepID=UPI003A9A5CEE